jgi:cobalamin biosynthesis Mg chelatase CobN
MKSKYRRGIDMVDKPRRYISLGLLLLTVAALVLVPAASASKPYFSALVSTYGAAGHSCGTCHIDPNGGSNLATYGKLFANQTNHVSSPAAALVIIGAPPGKQTVVAMQEPTTTLTETPTATSNVAITSDTVTVTQEPTTTSAETPTETIAKPRVTISQQTGAVADVTSTPIPVSMNKSSPGLGIAVAIGIIGTIYIMRKKK